MGNLAGYGLYKLGGSGGGGAVNTIYNADDTIGSNRVAIVTDELNFRSVDGAIYGGWVIKPSTISDAYAALSYGADEFIVKYRANQAYAFGKLSDTTNNFQFNTGANPNFLSQDTVYINGGSTHANALHILGGSSTAATSSLFIENSSSTEIFRLQDSAEAKILNNVASTLAALTLENQAGGSTHADCGVKLQFTNDAETGYIALYDSTSGGSNAPTMEIVSPLGLNYEAGAAYAGWHHRLVTDNAVLFGVTNSGTNAILTSQVGGGGGTYSEFQMAYTGGNYNFIKSQHNTGGKFIFGRENGGTFEYMRIAQDGEVLIGTATTDASALLNVSSTTKGFLQPRMTGAQVEAISSPATGLQAYATNAGAGDVTAAGWWGYDGTNWVQGFSSGGGSTGVYGGSGTIPTATIATLTDYLRFDGGYLIYDRAGASDVFNQMRRGTSLKISDKLVSGGGARSMRDSGGSDFYSISQGGLLLNRSASIGHFVAPTATLDIVGDGSTSATTSLLVRNSSANQILNIYDDGSFEFGNGATILDNTCIAIGNDAESLVTGSTSVGYQSKAGLKSTAIGYQADASAGQYNISIGETAICSAFFGVAIGRAASAGDRGLAINGTSTQYGTALNGVSAAYAVAVGRSSNAANHGTALGYDTDVTNIAVAVGRGMETSGIYSVSIGACAYGAVRTNTIASTFNWFTNNADPVVRFGETADQWNMGSGSFGFGTMTPDASAIIDLTSTTKGFLPPRMTTTERNAISSPATGLMLYNTTNNQWEGYTGSNWVILG